ncbi:MAG: (Fe-S)-binding protein [Candidatus Abyssobacteria bacterium SURF_5]|uniref:(Fe-S)-binding protein n=1 Tax=Abyssobacteria bacterium (strain SURF_5) TaxID=2093360 RepID=A0A3A4P161_ABYX5|nr:MAG: (Fe-S)-binding protein [Candidatus Abyssubacteria bacterium SURF_5]
MAGASFIERMAHDKQEIIEGCKECGTCLSVCPIRPFSRYAEKDTAQLQAARIAFLKGGEASDAVYDMAFSCMGCHFCKGVCPQGLNPAQTGIISRMELIRRGHAAPPAYSFALAGEHFNYFGIMSALLTDPSRKRWITEAPVSPAHADVVFFPGCGLHTMPDHLFACLDILDRMELNHVTLGGIAHCCGGAYMLAGKAEECGEFGDRLVQSISAFTPHTAVLFCPGCMIRLSESFFDCSGLPFRTMHLSQFLAENIDRLKFEKPIRKTVAIHDPCQLGRGLGEFEGSRKAVKAIPGIRLVELEHRGKETRCCGSPAAQHDPAAAKQMGLLLMEEAKKSGAELLVTQCLSCNRTFRGLAQGYPFEVVNFVALVGRALGIEYESKLPLYLKWRDVDRVIEDARANIEASAYTEQEVRFFLELLFSMA